MSVLLHFLLLGGPPWNLRYRWRTLVALHRGEEPKGFMERQRRRDGRTL